MFYFQKLKKIYKYMFNSLKTHFLFTFNNLLNKYINNIKNPMQKNEKKPSFYSVLSNATTSQKLLIFFLILLFTCNSNLTIEIALLFKEPLIICTDPITQTKFQCSEITACSYNYPFFIDKVNGPYSFTAEYELICENSAKKRFALTSIYVGYLAAAACQIAYMIDANRRKWFIAGAGYAVILSYFVMLMVDKLDFDFIIIAFFFFVAGMGGMYYTTYIFIFINENFKGDLASIATLIISIGWGSAGIFYTVIGYFVNCDWRVLVIIYFISLMVSSTYLACWKRTSEYQNEKPINKPIIEKENEDDDDDEEEEESHKNVNISIFSYFKDIWPNKTIRTNFLILVFVFGIYLMVNVVSYVELESVGGNIYFNTILVCCIEICSCFIASHISRIYPSDRILKFAMTVIVIDFLCFIFAPRSIGESSGLTVLFFVGCLLLSKLCNDMINLMIFLCLPKMLTDKYVGFYFIISRCSARLLTIFLPTINYIVRGFNLHPFVFYGVCYGICRILLIYSKDVQPDGAIDELMNDVKIGMMERTAIVSASHSMLLPDDILKNVKVDGIKLSVLKRFKQDPDSIKLQSCVFHLSAPLKKNIITSRSMHGNSIFYEMKEGLMKQNGVEIALAKQ